MKKIIDGKTYNTDTATLMSRGDNGLCRLDCWCRTEELYRTKSGNYFIFDENNCIKKIKNGVIHGYDLDGGDYPIQSWIEQWNVINLDKRELDLFGICDA